MVPCRKREIQWIFNVKATQAHRSGRPPAPLQKVSHTAGDSKKRPVPRVSSGVNWFLLQDPAAEGPYNMAKDEYLLRAAARWERPVLRLYGWRPMTLSVGRNQRVEEEIDLAACRREGVAVVRRSTGGWAVLHGTDLTYAVAAPAGAGFGGTIMEAYRSLAEVFAGLFAELGFRPEVQSHDSRERARRYGRWWCAGW